MNDEGIGELKTGTIRGLTAKHRADQAVAWAPAVEPDRAVEPGEPDHQTPEESDGDRSGD
jgi:hypothetical protein